MIVGVQGDVTFNITSHYNHSVLSEIHSLSLSPDLALFLMLITGFYILRVLAQDSYPKIKITLQVLHLSRTLQTEGRDR